MIPKNLSEVFVYLDDMLSEEDKNYLKESEENANHEHFGLGLWMRNNFGLWRGSELAEYFNGFDIYHADDMSGVILTSYHRYLNDIDLNLDKEFQHYIEYWKEQGIDVKKQMILNSK